MYSIFGCLENVPIRVFTMKEEHYEMMLMSIYGENEQVAKTKLNCWRR